MMKPSRFDSRRNFCAATLAGGLSLALYQRQLTRADDPPSVRAPRATDGDSRFEPDWSEKLTVSVGPTKADFVGTDHRVIQGALEYVKRLGGGTVHVLPGLYTCRNAIFLPSQVRLLGSGLDSILTKIDSETVALEQDSDWYDQEVTVTLPHHFQVGDGVLLRAINPHHGGATVIKRTLVARNGQRFKLDKGLRENLWISGKPTCSSLFPILTSEFTSDVWIENIAIDGNKTNNENLNGNYGGCIFLQDCQRYQFHKVTTRNYNGDGISFQICHDVLVEECHSHDNTDLGVHPGSGSQRPVIRNNKLNHNSQGIFWCWGVKYGLAEDNVLDGNRLYGTSIGHNDTDNVMVRNKILNSGKIGVLFRNESGGQDFFANRNRIENNEILNSGDENGIAIDMQGATKDVVLSNNVISETRSAAKRIGIRIGNEVLRLQHEGNTFAGLHQNIVDQRSA